MRDVLASGSVHISANFLAGAGVAVAVAAVLISILLWRLGSPRRLLTYMLAADTPLLTRGARRLAGDELDVSLGGQALTDPHVIAIQVASRSRRDIRAADFDDQEPLKLDMGTPVLKMLRCYTGGPDMPRIQVDVQDSKLAIGPGLLKYRQAIIVSLLTDGPVTLSCPNPALADVSVRHWSADQAYPHRRARQVLALLTILIVLAIGILTVASLPTTISPGGHPFSPHGPSRGG
jgi:hypothetical protein